MTFTLSVRGGGQLVTVGRVLRDGHIISLADLKANSQLFADVLMFSHRGVLSLQAYGRTYSANDLLSLVANVQRTNTHQPVERRSVEPQPPTSPSPELSAVADEVRELGQMLRQVLSASDDGKLVTVEREQVDEEEFVPTVLDTLKGNFDDGSLGEE